MLLSFGFWVSFSLVVWNRRGIMSLAKEHVETRNAPWPLLPSLTALAEKSCSPSPCWSHWALLSGLVFHSAPCSQGPPLQSLLGCRIRQALGECRPSHTVSNQAARSTDQTLPDWPCLVEPEVHVPQACATQVVAQRTASYPKVAALCPTGYKKHLAKEKALLLTVVLLIFQALYLLLKLEEIDCFIWKLGSLLRLSTCEQSQVLPLSLKDFLCNPGKAEVFQQ